MSSEEACGCVNDEYYGPALTNTCPSSFAIFMSIVDALIRHNCKINDPCGRIKPTTVPKYQYDFVIVGGGAGGALVAGRLAEAPAGWNILLLEAGPDEPPGTEVPAFSEKNFLGTDIDWVFKTEPETVAFQDQPDRRATWNKGKVLGGSVVLNGMVYIKPTRKNMEKWVEAGNTNWTYSELLSTLKKIEDNPFAGKGKTFDEKYWGKGGPFTVQQFNNHPEVAFDIFKAAKETGFVVSDDLDGDVYNGFGWVIANTRDGTRLTTAKAFLWPQRKNKKLHVMLNATATKLLVEEKNGTKEATQVQFVHNNITYRVRVNKEVILAAGSVQTPQILLLSGIGGKEALDSVGIEQIHDLPAVGKGIKDHVGFRIAMTTNQTAKNLLNWFSLKEYLRNGTGVMSSPGLTQVTARLSSEYKPPDDPDIMMFWNGYQANCAYNGDPNAPENPDSPNGNRTVETYVWNFQPLSKGYVSLFASNPFDHPKIVANYLTDERDVKVIISAIRKFQKWLTAPILKKYDLQVVNNSYGNCSIAFEYDSDEYWTCAIKFSTLVAYHPACSCKMGLATNQEACVDQKLQLYGVENIRIADASVLPDLPAANPVSSVIAVAQRCVDFIIEKYS